MIHKVSCISLLLALTLAGYAVKTMALSAYETDTATARTVRTAQAKDKVVLQGTFRGAAASYQVDGKVKLIDQGGKWMVRLAPDFTSTQGPDLYVWLMKGGTMAEGGLDLGLLKNIKGLQTYAVPAGIDVSRFQRVIIWCKEFRVLFGAAQLK